MPSIDDNRRQWARPDAWDDHGDVWSDGWGGPESQWSSWVAPRVRTAAGEPPFGRIVEIGCGHGRWTQFLATWSPEVVALDLAPECVAACERRFAEVPAVRSVLGDGRSLPTVPDRSVDLVFSFDSLVHADAEALGGYVAEVARVLTDDGVAWIHHSNLRASAINRWVRLRAIGPLHRLLVRFGVAEPQLHWRDPTVDARLVARLARHHGLVCPSQELLAWATRRTPIDCISVLTRPGAAAPATMAPRGRWVNGEFEQERQAAWSASASQPGGRSPAR